MSKQFEAKPLVRLTGPDLSAVELIQAENPGASLAEAIRIAIRSHVGIRDCVVRYRLPENHKNHRLFPAWRSQGPMMAEHALLRAGKLTANGFEVVVDNIGGTS